MMSNRIVALKLFAVLSACSSSPADVCGDGTELEHEGRSYCVYATEAITEEGFRCPAAFEFRFDFGEYAACGASDAQPPASFDEFVRQILGLVPMTGDAGADTGASPAGDEVLAATLPILEVVSAGDIGGVTGCITYSDGEFSAGSTAFDNEGFFPPLNQDCVFVVFEGLGPYDATYPDFFLISTDRWFLETDGLTRESRLETMRNPRDSLATADLNFAVPGSYPFRLYTENPDPGVEGKSGEMLESGTIEMLGYDESAREMSVRLTVDR